MDFNDQQFIWIAYFISNIAGLLFLFVAVRNTRLARLMFLLLFAWAGWFNFQESHQHPEVYLNYSDKSIGIYSNFINGWFKENITGFVTFIAVGQWLIAIGMFLKGLWVKLASIGIIVFLLAIAPLGVNSAFPFSLVVSTAAYFVLRKDDKDYLWKFNMPTLWKFNKSKHP